MGLITRILLVTALLLQGCASYAKFPVRAELLDETIDTTVDSRAAQYYLNHYLQGERLQPELDRRIDRVYLDFPAPIPDRESLRLISARFSNDFAALFLADRLWQSQHNRRLQRRFHHYLSLPREQLFAPPEATGDLLVLMVPGWDYLKNGHVTGSDFAAPRRLAERLGIENELVPVAPNGSVTQSAQVIAAAILRHRGSGKKIIIVGASSAGPAIHLALGRLLGHEQLAAVVAWVNLGGILHGSPLIDHFQRWPQKIVLHIALALLGWDNDEIMSMSAARSRQRARTLELPPGLLVINYLGLSLTGSLSSLSDYKYPIIADQGPNDGLTPLADIIAPGSLTLVATRSDHYFNQDPEIEAKTIAILKTVLDMIGERAPR